LIAIDFSFLAFGHGLPRRARAVVAVEGARVDPPVRVRFVWVFSMDFGIHVSEFPCVF